MKYIFSFLALIITVKALAQSDVQHTPAGASYRIFTHNTGEKIKVNDVVTFDFIQKTDKDSILASSYLSGNKGKAQCKSPDGLIDPIEINIVEVLSQLRLNDSVEVRIPTDSIYKGKQEQRPAVFPKGSTMVIILKIAKIQTLNEAIAERNAAMEQIQQEALKMKAAEPLAVSRYVAAHKLVLKSTASGLKYIITKPSLKLKPQKGDTLLVNYVGRDLNDVVFDTSIESIAKSSGTFQDGRPYEPIQFVVGAGNVIPGWDEGLLLMNEGAKAKLVIPSALAYGAQGSGDAIKPYSTLVFDVELVKVKPIKHAPKPIAKQPVAKKKPAAAKKN